MSKQSFYTILLVAFGGLLICNLAILILDGISFGPIMGALSAICFLVSMYISKKKRKQQHQ